MRGCLFTLLLGGAIIALLVVVGLPQVAAGVLTSAVSAAGLQADDTTVTVTSDPPTDLVGLHADRVTIHATDATFRGLAIGSVDLELYGMALLDRSADEVDGVLTDVTVPDVGGTDLTLDSISLGGGGDTITATTTIDAAQAETLIADAIERRTGARPTSVQLSSPNVVTVELGGATVGGVLDLTEAGDLTVTMADTPLGAVDGTLLHAGTDLPIRLTGLVVTPAGDLRLSGDLSIGILG
jgi:hypothetical protein